MRQAAHDDQGPKARQHMRPQQGRQRRLQAVRAQQRQQAELGQQRQYQGQGPVGAQARVLHDVQRPLARGTAAQAVGHVG